MAISYDNVHTSRNNPEEVYQKYESRTPLEFFGELFKRQNNENLTADDEKILKELISEIWEEEEL